MNKLYEKNSLRISQAKENSYRKEKEITKEGKQAQGSIVCLCVDVYVIGNSYGAENMTLCTVIGLGDTDASEELEVK